ncbi:TetR/AcrR family transcriptional regulator [Microbacterium sp. STN6]|uniref:TetR/AcrR family transcriptional regulator n=1 Tax=Microbacterium sp. STN6 TaxID=2995588 RepID=UPI002260A36E|nr:TetR/AcrR family transcriptional regulator [Microbacterium sp. STN6]MCX7522710.1 TetR/AcrR family transcriptional regulator [Microbacterium sp. STN6]
MTISRRDAILDAAVEVFGSVGYRGGSLRDVAGRVGVTVQGVLHYFPSKDDLLRGVLERRQPEVLAENEAAFERDGLAGLVAVIVRRNRDAPGVARLFTTLAAEATDAAHPAHSYFVERYRSVAAALAEKVTAEQSAGRMRPDVPVQTAVRVLVSLLDGLQLQYLLDPDFDVERTAREALALFEASRPTEQ